MGFRSFSVGFRQGVLWILSFAFLLFGIYTLVCAYRLTNPLEFIMAFFSSSLMILISLIGLIYPTVRAYQRWRSR
jgi:pilus assembly protein TadC